MQTEYWFGELARSLRDGFFADAVVLDLARILRSRNVTAEQRALFKRATEILDWVKEGTLWFDDPRMSDRTSTCANFFGQAVEALTMQMFYTSEAFLAEINKLRETAARLSVGEVPSETEMQNLRSFFFNSGKSSLEKTEVLMDGNREINKLRWLSSKA